MLETPPYFLHSTKADLLQTWRLLLNYPQDFGSKYDYWRVTANQSTARRLHVIGLQTQDSRLRSRVLIRTEPYVLGIDLNGRARRKSHASFSAQSRPFQPTYVYIGAET